MRRIITNRVGTIQSNKVHSQEIACNRCFTPSQERCAPSRGIVRMRYIFPDSPAFGNRAVTIRAQINTGNRAVTTHSPMIVVTARLLHEHKCTPVTARLP